MPADIKNLKDWHFEIDFEGIAWAVFDRQGETMNTLGRRATEELAAIVLAAEEAATRAEARGLVILSAKETSFIAGADIREFDDLRTEKDVQDTITQMTALLDRLEAFRIPVVAAIHGYCLGGGLELALTCHYRVADREEGTRFGFPEVKLGIFPGLNGTVRSIRSAGALDAMQLMLTGRMIRPEQARGMGLVDELVPTHHRLRWAARKAVLQKRRSRKPALWKRLLTKAPVRGLLANQMRKKTAAKVREEHYPAPFRLIDLFENFADDPERMKAAETRAFAPLMVSDTARNLRRVFRLSEMLKDEAPKGLFEPLRVHVVGAGTMGGDIAAWCVVCGMQASLQDLSEEQIGKALARAKQLFRREFRSPVQVDNAVARLLADKDGKHVPRADIVIEAVVEKLEVKRKVFEALEAKLKPGAILATNTSSLPLEEIASTLTDPGRLVGIHFFNPVARLPLVEVVRGSQTREEEVRKAAAFVTAIRKYPLIVKSAPGFLVNRVLAPYMMEAVVRLQQGESRDKIDKAAVKFGMPMGPLELHDLVGLDIAADVARKLGLGAVEDSELGRLVRAGKLGKKTGEGFYKWEKGKPKRSDETFSQDELARLGRALIQPMLEESQHALDEGIAASADHVDAGVVFGTGFAPFRGGPLHFAQAEKNRTRTGAQAA